MESDWRFAISTDAAHPDRFNHGCLWCFIFGRVGFVITALGCENNLAPANDPIRMAVRHFSAVLRCRCRLCVWNRAVTR